MDFRVAPHAESDLDEIWYFLATQSSNIDVADRVIDSITARFALLARQPYIARRRDEDWRPGVRSFVVGDYVIAYRVDGDNVLILRGSRDIRRCSAISSASAPRSRAAFDDVLGRVSATVHGHILATR
jgi:toxin ParE1/3/4